MPSNNITLDFKVDKLLNKLELLDKKVDKNSKDIEDLKKSVNMGRGSIRTLIIMGGLNHLMENITNLLLKKLNRREI